MQPLVSIIIPTYNRAHLIGETLDSILDQSYDNWECIVVDDGSTDDTSRVLKEYIEKDSRFHYHERTDNKKKGANACRNYGFQLSKGEYINWFDSDDLMMPKKLETQVNQLHESTSDFAVCQTMMYDANRKEELGLRAPRLKSDNIFEDYILNKIFFHTNSPLWKKIFLSENSFCFDERLQQAQDYDFHMRVLAVSQNYVVHETSLVLVNLHDSNMGRSEYDHPSKIFSNVLVKYNIINHYSRFLSDEGKAFILKEIIVFYLNVIRLRHKRIAFKMCAFILNVYRQQTNLFPYGFIKTSFYVVLPLVYGVSGKGFRLTKYIYKIVDIKS